MPCATIHRAIARIINKKQFNYEKEELFLLEIGSIAADSWRHATNINRQKSHFVNNHEEDINLFLDKYSNQLDNPFFLGYFIHILTDYYFRYNPTYESSSNIDIYKKLIHDLDIYNIPILSEEELNLIPIIPEVDKDALQISIDYLYSHPYSTRTIPNDYIVLLDKLNSCVTFIEQKLKELNQ